MGRKRKLHTYEVYIIVQGTKSTILTTTDKREATRKYSTLCGGGALPHSHRREAAHHRRSI